MRVLLIPAAGGVGLGPLTNILAIAEELQMAGHDVGILCRDSWAPIIGSLDLRMYPAPAPQPYHGYKPPPFKLSDVIIGLGWAEEDYIRVPTGISLAEAEREIIRSTLAQKKGNKSKTAETLGIGRKTLHRKILEYQLE